MNYGKIIKAVYTKALRPLLVKYVQKTDNEWDDRFVVFLDEIIDVIASLIKDTKSFKVALAKTVDSTLA